MPVSSSILTSDHMIGSHRASETHPPLSCTSKLKKHLCLGSSLAIHTTCRMNQFLLSQQLWKAKYRYWRGIRVSVLSFWSVSSVTPGRKSNLQWCSQACAALKRQHLLNPQWLQHWEKFLIYTTELFNPNYIFSFTALMTGAGARAATALMLDLVIPPTCSSLVCLASWSPNNIWNNWNAALVRTEVAC